MSSQKYIILERNFDDTDFLKLESDFDSSMTLVDVNSLGLFEIASAASPIMSLKLTDGLGESINKKYISPDATYDLYLGKIKQKVIPKNSFSISVSKMKNTVMGKSDHISSELTFLSSKWDKLIKDTHSRSWTNKKYSEVVQIIAEEVGFDSKLVDIEDTNKNFNIIQPDWTNFQLLKWISSRAVSTNNLGGYILMITLDGRFIFKSIDTLLDQKPKRVLYLSQLDNEEIGTFKGIKFSQNYSPILSQGGFGMDYYYFDYETKKFINNKRKFSDSSERQLSDWSFIASSHENAEKRFFGGRDIDTESVVDSKISQICNSVHEVIITIDGDSELHIGDIIKLFIPPSEYLQKVPINETYSGHWLIKKVSHKLSFTSKLFITELSLSRAGINGFDRKGLIKTKSGKQLNT